MLCTTQVKTLVTKDYLGERLCHLYLDPFVYRKEQFQLCLQKRTVSTLFKEKNILNFVYRNEQFQLCLLKRTVSSLTPFKKVHCFRPPAHKKKIGTPPVPDIFFNEIALIHHQSAVLTLHYATHKAMFAVLTMFFMLHIRPSVCCLYITLCYT